MDGTSLTASRRSVIKALGSLPLATLLANPALARAMTRPTRSLPGSVRWPSSTGI